MSVKPELSGGPRGMSLLATDGIEWFRAPAPEAQKRKSLYAI
jgi:hypothetical protein